MTPFAVWLVCGFLAYGAIFAHCQREYPTLAKHDESEDRRFALLVALLGPFGIFATAVATAVETGRPFRHGFRWL